MKSMKTIIYLFIIGIITSCCETHADVDRVNMKTSKKVFDLTNGHANGAEPDQKIIDEMTSISDSPLPVYIDWQLRFSGIDDFDCGNCIVSFNQTEGMPIAGDSSLASYLVPVNSYSTHFIFNVLIGPTIQFPFNAVSCYRSGGDQLTISIKGFYTAISYTVPTAVALELRPVNPYLMPPVNLNN
jgi:hypothetical protein